MSKKKEEIKSNEKITDNNVVNKDNNVAVLDLQKLAEKIKAASVNEVRRDFRDFAYRLFSVELVLYGIVKGKKNLSKEQFDNVMLQEDILIANVETILSRMKELEEKNNPEESKKDLEEENKND